MRHSVSCIIMAGFIQAASSALAQAPSAIESPGSVPVATIHAQGAQVYQCQADAAGRLTWQFREPIATLLAAGKTIGRHYAGPSWELDDGTLLTAKVIARAPGATADDIPSLLLSVDQVRGDGSLTEVTTIRRHNTRGGLASGSCSQAGAFLSVPYSADYTFLKATVSK